MANTPTYNISKSEGENSSLGGWVENFFRVDLLRSSPKCLANIPNPVVEYGIYCTFKTVEFASLFGGMLARPLYAQYVLKRTPPDKITVNTTKIARAAGRKLQGQILLASLFMGPLVVFPLALQLGGCTRTELKEKCYQIRCDERTIMHDRLTLLMGFAGWYWKRFQGAVDFINGATVYTTLRFRLLSEESSNIAMKFVADDDRYASPADAELDMRQLTRFFRRSPTPNAGEGTPETNK
uniref:Uncharacterized protein n=1 Tax=Globodera rostochiensis TaxID=31243 RepID=A0A914H4J6_GLORO